LSDCRCSPTALQRWELGVGHGAARLAVGVSAVYAMTAQLMSTPDAPYGAG